MTSEAIELPAPLPRILLVEDDAVFAGDLEDFLKNRGFRTAGLSSLDDLTTRIADFEPDIIVLDQFVGQRDSLLLLAEIRRAFSGGIVFFTANPDQADRIVALETGADDFIAKSLGSREFLARLRSVLRRTSRAAGRLGNETDTTLPKQQPRCWHLDVRLMEARAPDGTDLGLTHAEFETLLLMARHAGQVVTRDQISETVLRRPFSPFDRSVDNIVSRIRKALDPHVIQKPVFLSIRGRGYVFHAFNLSETNLREETAPATTSAEPALADA